MVMIWYFLFAISSTGSIAAVPFFFGDCPLFFDGELVGVGVLAYGEAVASVASCLTEGALNCSAYQTKSTMSYTHSLFYLLRHVFST
jgi:hypothetical protein